MSGIKAVTECDSLDRSTFLEVFRTREPVVLRGGARYLPAMERWTLDYLESRVGNIDVRPLRYRPGARRAYAEAEFVTMSFADFCAELRTGNGQTLYWFGDRVSNVFFGGADKQVEVNASLAPLAEDFAAPAFLRDTELIYGQVILGTGRNGTVAHHDFGGEAKFLAQLCGEKDLLLVPPQDAAHLALRSIADPGNFTLSSFDLRAELEHVAVSATIYRTTLRAGDAIYWPSFWVHDVVNRGALNCAISVALDELTVSPLMLRHLLAMNLQRIARLDPTFSMNQALVRRLEDEILGFGDVRTLWQLHTRYMRT
jgi:hypothetical protein